MRKDLLSRLQASAANTHAHAGLLLSHYLSEPYSDKETFQKARLGLYRLVIEATHVAQEFYQKAFNRWVASFRNDPKNPKDPLTPRKYEVEERLILGLGGENVLETGLTLHHTYGMPVIPGTALKGLAWHYCHQVWGEVDPGFQQGKEFHAYLFGTTEQRGAIAFHDAWISPSNVKKVKKSAEERGVLLDVLTPHHGTYYSEKTDCATDFDDPNPIPFLSVKGTFFVPITTAGPEAEKDRNLTYQLLTQSLRDWGVGGKTSSGYGRMHPEN